MRARPLLFVTLFAAAFTGAPRLDRWNVIGPGGGGGQFIPTVSPHDPNRVLAACDMTGSYISHDGGESWRMFNLGNRARFFVFDPVDANTIYAKTVGPPLGMSQDRPVVPGALFRSADAGTTWRLVREDPIGGGSRAGASGELTALAVDPADSRILRATFVDGGSSALYESKDAGKTWAKSKDFAEGTREIFVDPRSPKADRTVYVMGDRMMTIRERGSWRSGEPVPTGTGGRPNQAIRAVSAGFPSIGGSPVVYVTSQAGLFMSEDGGVTWQRREFPNASSRLTSVATSLRNPDVVYLSYNSRGAGGDSTFGVAKSTNRGRSWEFVWKETRDQRAPSVHDSWMSERFGPSWAGNPFDLGVAPGNADVCFGTDYGRTMRTTNGGRTWVGAYSKKQPDGAYASTGLDVTTCYGVHFDPFDPKRVFISYTDIALFRSENGGRTWISSSEGVPREWLNTTYWIAFDPAVKGRVWGAMSGAHDLPRPKMWSGFKPVNYRGGVCRSDDGGRTWRSSNNGMPETATTHILLDPRSPAAARVLYATGFGRGVFKSTDGGASWTSANHGIAEQEPFAWRLTMDSKGHLYLLVARRRDDGGIGGQGDGVLYRSTDGAGHWKKVNLPDGVNGPHGLAVDPKDPRRLYLAAWGRRPSTGTVGGGIFLSADSGATWRNVLSRDQHVYDITVDPRDPKTLYSSGFESSAWRSTDRGESWKRIPGFNFKWGHRVFPDPLDPSSVYITTYGGSVWHGPAAGDPAAPEDVVGPRPDFVR